MEPTEGNEMTDLIGFCETSCPFNDDTLDPVSTPSDSRSSRHHYCTNTYSYKATSEPATEIKHIKTKTKENQGASNVC